MKRFVHFVRHTRRFRYTLTMLLVFGALFAVTRTQSQEDAPAEEPSTSAEAATDAGHSEASPEANVPTSTEKPSSETPAASVSEVELRQKVVKLLEGLGARISSDSTPETVTIPSEILELVYGGDGADGSESLRTKLSDAEQAGTFIHDLRLRGFVPVKSLRWINPVADAPLESSKDNEADQQDHAAAATLMAIITVDDKRNPDVPNWEPRHRAIKIHFKQSAGDLLISDIKHPTVRELGGITYLEDFIQKLKEGKVDEAWASGSKLMQSKRDATTLLADLKDAGFLDATSIEWGEETGIEGGYKLRGTLDLGDEKSLPFYVALLETEDGLKVLDFQMTDSFLGRIFGGRGDTLDMVVAVIALALVLGFIYIIVSYVKGLWGSPRELYILFFTKITEYSAYGAAQLTFMFYLRDDVGLSDIGAGTYYSTWSTIVTAVTMVVGAICDAIGIKKTLLIGSVLLLLSRAVMPYADDIWIVTLLGFIPLGIGVAITGPVLSVGIKRYTTIEGAALGFGLFYTLMNVGWAVGAWIFDVVRVNMGERGSLEFMGDTLSTWQVLFGLGFFINVPDLLAILWMRDGAEMTEDGLKIHKKTSEPEKAEGPAPSLLARSLASVKAGAIGSVKVFGDNFIHRAFWVFILLIGVTVFTRLTFFHFHITWPSYGIRYFG
ncbi:MAG: MFS transporter, partial [Verrucomicrobiae bacterium]|nr:MFS transporter [Verrucomicrobiae bacterium]NNJ85805.1 MFS transporter [Akkermansiaceae bacterium]